MRSKNSGAFVFPLNHEYTHNFAFIQGLEKLNGSDEYRKTIEQLWKRKLRTFKPYGLNTKD
ncbi:hypothetical protein DPMN_150123 [Dreissena polymorpha]|uniref:Uncharacterized protein n=1 Tax=Dreissena polymorpha TaxID=45954 RepID=A0A9D4FCP6_DREPO|nr:hypothetical protein DPMN_150123 [Dreissena polymorpha]